MNQRRVADALISIIGVNDAEPILERAGNSKYVQNLAAELETSFGSRAARKIMIQMADRLRRSEPAAAKSLDRLLMKET